MAKYYFVTTLLPPLKIGAPPEIDSPELDFILKQNLTKDDYQKVIVLRRLVEIENIRYFWQGAPIEAGGNFDEKEVEENLLHHEGYPSYVFQFMEKYEETKERLKHFPELIKKFFHYELKERTGFVKEYLQFEWEWRLIFVALRAKNLGRSIVTEMQYEDPEDPFVQQILEQKDAETYLPPEKFAELKEIYEAKKSTPLDLALTLSQWRFDKIEDLIGWHTFDVSCVLGYVIQHKIVEKWLKLDKKKGLELIEQILA